MYNPGAISFIQAAHNNYPWIKFTAFVIHTFFHIDKKLLMLYVIYLSALLTNQHLCQQLLYADVNEKDWTIGAKFKCDFE